MKNSLKVKSCSDVNKLAGAIASILIEKEENKTEKKGIELTCVGAGAVNQAVKSIAIARGFVSPMGINLICIPAFTEVNIENEQRTGIKFILKEEE